MDHSDLHIQAGPPAHPPPDRLSPAAPSKVRQLPLVVRALIGAAVGASVGAEIAYAVALTFLFLFTAPIGEQAAIAVMMTALGQGGAIGALLGIVGGVLWGRLMRAALAFLVVGLAGAILDNFGARFVLPRVFLALFGTDIAETSLSVVSIGGTVLGALGAGLFGAWRGWIGKRSLKKSGATNAKRGDL